VSERVVVSGPIAHPARGPRRRSPLGERGHALRLPSKQHLDHMADRWLPPLLLLRGDDDGYLLLRNIFLCGIIGFKDYNIITESVLCSCLLMIISKQSLLDRDSPLPLYYQLRQILLHHILSGDIAPGELLPTEQELQERHGVSRITVRRAMSDLASEGYISRQAGRGTFVQRAKVQDRSEKLGGFVDDLVAQGYKVKSQILQDGVRPVPHCVAQKLGIDEGQPVLYFERLVYADGEPIGLATAYFNVGQGITFTREELNSDSIFPLLEHKYNIVLQRADKTIEATVALGNEAKLLGVRPNTPLLLTELIAYDEQGQRVGFVKTIYRGDRYKYYHQVTR
jgi:GntR family transcriptional regulator